MNFSISNPNNFPSVDDIGLLSNRFVNYFEESPPLNIYQTAQKLQKINIQEAWNFQNIESKNVVLLQKLGKILKFRDRIPVLNKFETSKISRK